MTADEKRNTLLALYPQFKHEVYRRREQMMRWTVAGACLLIAILFALLLIPTAGHLTLGHRVLLAGAILLLAATFSLLILQQQHRHYQAKRTLIELERALGLFDRDRFLHDRPLYPEEWQTAWSRDRSTIFYLALLGLFAALAVAALFVAA